MRMRIYVGLVRVTIYACLVFRGGWSKWTLPHVRPRVMVGVPVSRDSDQS